MKDFPNALPRTALLDMATFDRSHPSGAPPNPTRRVSSATIIACIEEALRILDDDFGDDEFQFNTTSSHSPSSQSEPKNNKRDPAADGRQ